MVEQLRDHSSLSLIEGSAWILNDSCSFACIRGQKDCLKVGFLHPLRVIRDFRQKLLQRLFFRAASFSRLTRTKPQDNPGA